MGSGLLKLLIIGIGVLAVFGLAFLFFGRGDPKSLGRYTLGNERSVDDVGEFERIREAEIDALPGQRMNRMRRIADQRQSILYIFDGMLRLQRESTSWAGRSQRAKHAVRNSGQ